VYLHSSLGYEEGSKVKIVSEYGEVVLDVVVNDDVRHNCLVVPSNTVGVNKLTPSIVSNEGENACYQEVKVTLEKVEG
jgi:predicted molibdopterin-dependent oxidoreductase YjgC